VVTDLGNGAVEEDDGGVVDSFRRVFSNQFKVVLHATQPTLPTHFFFCISHQQWRSLLHHLIWVPSLILRSASTLFGRIGFGVLGVGCAGNRMDPPPPPNKLAISISIFEPLSLFHRRHLPPSLIFFTFGNK